MVIAEVKGVHDGKDFVLTLDVTDTALSCSVDVELQLDADVARLALQVSYQGGTPTLTIPALALSGIGACLAGCGMASVVGPIVQCAKANKTLPKFKQCVKGKGLSIAATTAECILACLGGVAAGHP